MPIDIACSCGKKLKIKEEHAGRKFKCPACGGTIQTKAPALSSNVTKPGAAAGLPGSAANTAGQATRAAPVPPSKAAKPNSPASSAAKPPAPASNISPPSVSASSMLADELYALASSPAAPPASSREEPLQAIVIGPPGATAGLPSSAANTGGQATRGARGGWFANAQRIFWLIGSSFSYAALGATLASRKKQRSDGKKRLHWFFRLILGFAGVMLLLASPFYIMSCYHNYRTGQESEKWPNVKGAITRSDMDVQGFGRKMTYTPMIAYRYSVNGMEYSGSRVQFVRTAGSSESSAQSVLAKYPVNSTPTVYYDPANPTNCVLEPGNTSTGMVLSFVGPLFVLGMGVFCALAALKA
jgi:hypothetical protein